MHAFSRCYLPETVIYVYWVLGQKDKLALFMSGKWRVPVKADLHISVFPLTFSAHLFRSRFGSNLAVFYPTAIDGLFVFFLPVSRIPKQKKTEIITKIHVFFPFA